MQNKLKPCPFCGGKAYKKRNWDFDGNDIYGIHCENCNAQTEYRCSEQEAIEAWNRRVYEKM